MIDEIKNIVIENKKSFNLDNFSLSEIKISKFFHGRPSTSNKVLFFVSLKNNPICLIKMVRDSGDNNLIQREIEGIRYFHSLNLKTPEIFSNGEINGGSYFCQSILRGVPVGKDKEVKVFPDIAKYHKTIPKTEKIKIKKILEPIKTLKASSDKAISKILEQLSLRENNEIFIANQHGDLTYKNLIIDNKGEISFIDFENFGLRSIWGIDVVHYMIRITDARIEREDVSSTVSHFVSASREYRDKYNLNISDEECVDLLLLDLLFEVLKKNFFSLRKDINPLVKNIWSR